MVVLGCFLVSIKFQGCKTRRNRQGLGTYHIDGQLNTYINIYIYVRLCTHFFFGGGGEKTLEGNDNFLKIFQAFDKRHPVRLFHEIFDWDDVSCWMFQRMGHRAPPSPFDSKTPNHHTVQGKKGVQRWVLQNKQRKHQQMTGCCKILGEAKPW